MRSIIRKLALCGAAAMILLTQFAAAASALCAHDPKTCTCCASQKPEPETCCDKEGKEKPDGHQQKTEDDCRCFKPKQNDHAPDATLAPGGISLIDFPIIRPPHLAVAITRECVPSKRFTWLRQHPPNGPPPQPGDSRAPPA